MLWYVFAFVLCVYMCVWYVVSLIQKRNDVADVAWGLGFVLLAWISLLLAQPDAYIRPLLVTCMVTVWGIRLAYHIHKRHSGKSEDARYAAWRSEWVWFKTRSFFQVFMLQGLLLFIVALPILFITTLPSPMMVLDVFGFALWCTGMFFEVAGDRQLKYFIADAKNKGKLCTVGLWRYTRHPNYFGEVTLWWGVWLISVAATYTTYIPVFGVAVWVPLVSVLGPLTITFLLLKVSGVPMLEKSMEKHPEWSAYATKTNRFFPWLPRSSS